MAYLNVQHTNDETQSPLKEFRYLYVVLFCVFLWLAMMGADAFNGLA